WKRSSRWGSGRRRPRVEEALARRHGARIVSYVFMASRLHDARDARADAAPVARLLDELPASGRGQPVELRTPIVLGRPPFRREEPGELQPVQRGVEGALLHAQHVVRRPLGALGDAAALSRAAGERLQDEHVERALEQLALDVLALEHRRPPSINALGEYTARAARGSLGSRRADARRGRRPRADYQSPSAFHHANPTVSQTARLASETRKPTRHQSRSET